jgi:hypothetical protein
LLETFRQIKSWLERCTQDHLSCIVDRTDCILPKRLVDLTKWHENQSLRLIESRTIDRDQENPPLYMTLTYKWTTGTTAAALTTSSNISARLITLSASTLPLLFSHAIEAAHKLHVPYLWIDSLCILQDSKEDFATEAAMMSTTYRNSYCTISAGLDDTDTFGLFRQRDVHNDAVEFELRDAQSKTRRVRAVKQQEWWTTMFGKGPLQQRGWCLQERELYPRVLHFTPTQILWECRCLKASQGLPKTSITLEGEQARMLDLIPTLSVLEIHKQWHYTVAAYTARHLTEYTDTFPALSGLAKIVYQFLDQGKREEEYLASIWCSNLRRSLAWHTTNVQRREPVRHPGYIAPSWSWASVNGTITYEQGIRKETDRLNVVHEPGLTATIKKWEMELASGDPFGPLVSAELLICAPLVDAILEPAVGSSSYYLYGPTGAQQDRRGRWIGHIAFDVHSESERLKVVRYFATPSTVNMETGARRRRVG